MDVLTIFIVIIINIVTIQGKCPCFIEDNGCQSIDLPLCVYALHHDYNVTFGMFTNDFVKIVQTERARSNSTYPDEFVRLHGTDQFNKRNAAIVFVCNNCASLRKLPILTVSAFRTFILSIYLSRTTHRVIHFMENNNNVVSFVPKILGSEGKQYYSITNGCFPHNQLKLRSFVRPLFFNQKYCLSETTFIMNFRQTKLIKDHVNDGQFTTLPNYAFSHINGDANLCRVIIEVPSKTYDFNILVTISCVCRTSQCVKRVSERSTVNLCFRGTSFEMTSTKVSTMYVKQSTLFYPNPPPLCTLTLRVTPTQKFFSFSSIDNLSIAEIPDENTGLFAIVTSKDLPNLGKSIRYPLTESNMTFFATDVEYVNNILQQILLNEYLPRFQTKEVCEDNPLSGSRFLRSVENDVSKEPCLHYYSVFLNKTVYPMTTINAQPIRRLHVYGLNVIVFISPKIVNLQSKRHFDLHSTIVYESEASKPSNETTQKIANLLSNCPNSINDTHYAINKKSSIFLCGVIIHGLTWKGSGSSYGWRPNRVEYKPLEKNDIQEFNLTLKRNTVECAFNLQDIKTLCTCSAELGNCWKFYYFAKLHVTRFAPLNSRFPAPRLSWGFNQLRDWKKRASKNKKNIDNAYSDKTS